MKKFLKVLGLIVKSYYKIQFRLSLVHFLLAFTPRDLSLHIRPRLYKMIGFNIGKGVSIVGNVSIDNYTGSFANLVMGNRSYLSHGCHITLNSKVTIEDNATVGPFVKIFTDSHTFENPKRRFGKMISRPVTIKEGAFIGAGAIILQGVTIGEGAIVGAGTVVAKDVPPQTTVIGNPMKNLGPVRNAGEQQETPVTPINAAAGLS